MVHMDCTVRSLETWSSQDSFQDFRIYTVLYSCKGYSITNQAQYRLDYLGLSKKAPGFSIAWVQWGKSLDPMENSKTFVVRLFVEFDIHLTLDRRPPRPLDPLDPLDQWTHWKGTVWRDGPGNLDDGDEQGDGTIGRMAWGERAGKGGKGESGERGYHRDSGVIDPHADGTMGRWDEIPLPVPGVSGTIVWYFILIPLGSQIVEFYNFLLLPGTPLLHPVFSGNVVSV